MDHQTQGILNALNRRFYRRFAGAFDTSRHAPWQGWGRIVGALEGQDGEGPLPVLDVGCGNGRFGALLAERWGASRLIYRGVDSSLELLDRARRRPAAMDGAWGWLEFVEADVLEEPVEEWAQRSAGQDAGQEPGWGLIAAFGLMHHMPARHRRRRLLEDLALRLAPGGVLAVALWRFGADPRFERRRIPWARYNEAAPAAERLDEAQLEPGDWLLRWGSSPEGDGEDPAVPVGEGAFRYCHAVGEDEEEELIAALEPQAPLWRRFDADGRSGRLNRYLLFRRLSSLW
jgi:SAM-dependent methyltransferase